MIAVRSLLFQVLFYAWTVALCILYLPLLAAPRSWIMAGARLWIHGGFLLLRTIIGLSHEVRGGENIPTGPALIVAKHQSMWDTLVFHTLLPDPVFILKKELIAIPFFGWYLKKAGSVPIDRSAGARTLKQMAEATRQALAKGRQVIIFPEGTRTAPGDSRPYNSGVALLYGLGAPVIPVALNSGLFWGRHTFLRKPGRIVIEFLPPMPEGMDRRVFLKDVQDRIEGACRQLA